MDCDSNEIEKEYNKTSSRPRYLQDEKEYDVSTLMFCGIAITFLMILVAVYIIWSKRRRFDIVQPQNVIDEYQMSYRPNNTYTNSALDTTGDYFIIANEEQVDSNSNKSDSALDATGDNFIIANEEQVESNTNKPTHYRKCIKEAELWSKKMISLGNYDQKSFSLYCFRAGIFDKDGGKLHFDETGVALLIPPRAIQTPQLIYIYLHHDEIFPPNTIKTSPVVYCGPPGMKFSERVVLSYKHCANVQNSNVNLLTLRTETEPDQCSSFHNLSEDKDSMTLIRGNTVTLLLPHFTGHTTVVQENNEESATGVEAEKWLDLMIFSSKILENDYDLQLRLYCANKTPDARYFVLEDERLQNGSMCFPSTPFLFASNYDVNVFLNSEGNWTVCGGKNKQVIAKKCLVENDRTPCVYNLEYDEGKAVARLKCQVHVSQDGRDESSKIMDVLVKKQPGNQVDQESRSLVRRRLLLPYPIRECIRKQLDIHNTLGNDWRKLADCLGYDDCIQQWEEQFRHHVITSPTNELLNVWEAQSSDETDLVKLIDIFRNKMQRLDIISEIDKWDLYNQVGTSKGSKWTDGLRDSIDLHKTDTNGNLNFN